jgi:nucleoside 2-deoxyribosyltransferase
MSDKTAGRLQELREIKTPLALLALVVLVIETILLILANKATGTDLTLLIIAMPLLLVGLLAGVFLLLGKRPDALGSQPREPVIEMKHDVFLAAPMASHPSDADYKTDRAEMNRIVETMEKECGFPSVFYAGKHIPTGKEFDAADISVKQDYEALRSSRRFVMVYPFKLASSVLVEAGMAIALKKPTLIFTRDRNELPFLLKEAEQAFPGVVKIYEYQTPADIREKFHKHRASLFGN